MAVDTVDSVDDIYAVGQSSGNFEGHTSSGSSDIFLIKVRVLIKLELGVSKNRGTPKSSNLIGFSIINHPFWGTPIFGNTHF